MNDVDLIEQMLVEAVGEVCNVEKVPVATKGQRSWAEIWLFRLFSEDRLPQTDILHAWRFDGPQFHGALLLCEEQIQVVRQSGSVARKFLGDTIPDEIRSAAWGFEGIHEAMRFARHGHE